MHASGLLMHEKDTILFSSFSIMMKKANVKFNPNWSKTF